MFLEFDWGPDKVMEVSAAGKLSFDFRSGAIEDAVAVMEPGFDESMNEFPGW